MILISNIQWDTEGMTLDECNLPENVLIIKDEYGELHDIIGSLLVDKFGFNHSGFEFKQLYLEEMTPLFEMEVLFPKRFAVLLSSK